MAPKASEQSTEERYWRRVMARAQAQQPGMDRAVLAWVRDVRQRLSPAAVIEFVANNDVDRMVSVLLSDDALDVISQPLSQHIFTQVQSDIDYFKRSVPAQGAMRLGFDVQNPYHIDALRSLDTKVVKRLKDDVRATVKTFAEDGLRNAIGPRKIGKQIEQVVGLVPKHLQEVANFRKALEDHDVDAVLNYRRRDARFDARVMRGDYGKEEIDLWTERYRARRVAWNAETISRTATMDSLKSGERMTWEASIARKLVDRDRLMKEWIGVMDDRERLAHKLMEKQRRHFDEIFSNGELIPGESTYNCRCLARYFEERARRRTANRSTSQLPAAASAVAPPQPTPPPALTPQELLQRRLLETEERISGYSVEHAVGYSRQGVEILNKTSNLVDEVQFTNAEIQLLADAIMTHNHPSGTWGLSAADVGFAMSNELAEIRAVTRDRLSRMSKNGSKYWGTAAWDLIVYPAYLRHRRVVLGDWSAEVRAGRMTLADYQRLAPHEIWERVAKEVGLNYVSEPRQSP